MATFGEGADLDVLAEDNVRTLAIPNSKLSTPVAIILVGVPASGKSFLAKSLAQALPIAILSEEEMLKFLAPRITFFKRAQEQVIVLALKTIEKLIKRGVSCVFDYNLKKRYDRAVIRQSVEDAGGRMVVVYIDISREDAYEQISKGNYQVSRGEKKGVIYNKDLFEYEFASTMVPAAEEKALVYRPRDPDSLSTIIEQITKFTK